jgi:hypothetical protein
LLPVGGFVGSFPHEGEATAGIDGMNAFERDEEIRDALARMETANE